MNIAFHYQYRDGANWKESTSVVFANPSSLTTEGVEELLRECLFENDNFIAEKVGLPTCYFEDESDDGKYAHGLHEFFSIKETDEEPNDKANRAINQLIVEFAAQSLTGWEPVRQIE
jgi:hypothetical protein